MRTEGCEPTEEEGEEELGGKEKGVDMDGTMLWSVGLAWV